uniref:Uncharacterized protein MANES_01G195400 n=1 Tax=Rhizophora mucronata TaxID=61149 RepID=A0A2P2Q0X6_RHIMU
MYASRIVNSVT